MRAMFITAHAQRARRLPTGRAVQRGLAVASLLLASCGQPPPCTEPCTGASTPGAKDEVVVEAAGTAPTDLDGDGWTSFQDCDDGNAEVHPGVTNELLNGLDDDCDGTVDLLVRIDLVARLRVVGTEETPLQGWLTTSPGLFAPTEPSTLWFGSVGDAGISRVPRSALDPALNAGEGSVLVSAVTVGSIASTGALSPVEAVPRDIDGDGLAEVLSYHEDEEGILIGDVYYPAAQRFVLHSGADLQEGLSLPVESARLIFPVDEEVSAAYFGQLVDDVTGDGRADIVLGLRLHEGDAEVREVFALFGSEMLVALPAPSVLMWSDATALVTSAALDTFGNLREQDPIAPFAVPDLDGDGISDLALVFDRVTGASTRVAFIATPGLATCGWPCTLPMDVSQPVVADILHSVQEGGNERFGFSNQSVGWLGDDGEFVVSFGGTYRVDGASETHRETRLFLGSQLAPGRRLTREDAHCWLDAPESEASLGGTGLFVGLDDELGDELVVLANRQLEDGSWQGWAAIIPGTAVEDGGDLGMATPVASFVGAMPELSNPRFTSHAGLRETGGRGQLLLLSSSLPSGPYGTGWLVELPTGNAGR